MKRNKLYYILFVLYILATAFVLYVNGIFTGNVASFLNLAINGVFLAVVGFVISAVLALLFAGDHQLHHFLGVGRRHLCGGRG